MLNQLFMRHEPNKTPKVVQVVGFPVAEDWRLVYVRRVSLIRTATHWRVDAASLNPSARCVGTKHDAQFQVMFDSRSDAFVVTGPKNANATYYPADMMIGPEIWLPRHGYI